MVHHPLILADLAIVAESAKKTAAMNKFRRVIVTTGVLL
jgi:hypothetical protein